MRPKRIQRRRTKGWRMPAHTKCVDRSARWGNPFDWRKLGKKKAAALHRRLLMGKFYCPEMDRRWGFAGVVILCAYRAWVLKHIHELRGKNLACWCEVTDPCHGDTLLELANRSCETASGAG